MKQVIVGSYEMGWGCVQIVLREGTGGEFFVIPEKGKISRIKIGADYDGWWEVVNVLLHEAYELEIDNRKLRFRATQNRANDHADYLFVLTHNQFTDATAYVSEMVAACLPDLAMAWKKWRKTRKANNG